MTGSMCSREVTICDMNVIQIIKYQEPFGFRFQHAQYRPCNLLSGSFGYFITMFSENICDFTETREQSRSIHSTQPKDIIIFVSETILQRYLSLTDASETVQSYSMFERFN